MAKIYINIAKYMNKIVLYEFLVKHSKASQLLIEGAS